MNTKTKILIVEDEWLIAEVIQATLEKLGYEVIAVAATGEDAVKKAKDGRPDVVLMDIVLEGKMDGIEAADRIASFSDVPIIFQTAYSDEKILERAKVSVPFGFLIKPVNARELHTTIKMALYKHGLDKKLQENQRKLALSLKDSMRRRAEVSALLESVHAVLKQRKFPDAARVIFDAAKKIIGAAAGYVALLTPDGLGNEIVFLDSGGRPCTVDPLLPMPVRGLREEACRLKKAVYENNFLQSAWMKFIPEGHAPLDNVLFAPLIIEEKAVGVMGLANKPEGFTKEDARMAVAFAEHAALALANGRALDALEKSEARFRAVAESAVDAIVTADVSGRIVTWNEGALKTFGYAKAEAMGQSLTMLMPERFREAHQLGFKRLVAGGEPRVLGKTVELAALRKDGSEFPIELSLSAWEQEKEKYFTAIIHDITERKESEKNLEASNNELRDALEKLKKAQTFLIRSEKLSSLGTMSAGVAHEILNPLNIIATIAQVMQLKELPEEDQSNLSEILNQVRRATKITNALRMFAHQKKGEMAPTRIEEVFGKVATLIEHDLNLDNVVIDKIFDKNLPVIQADEDQLTQIFLNLLNNARDAMRPRRGGVIKVEGVSIPGGVEIRFTDNGPGIPASILDKIFDPFFTTKDPGQGTGMGLAIVSSMVERHGGTIRVESEEGKGAAFVITLPTGGG